MTAAPIDLRSDVLAPPTDEMWEAMRAAPLGWATNAEDPSVNELQERAAAPDLAGRVTLAGYVHPTWPVLAAADVVVVPSRAVPFGNTAVEGLLARRPVVASRSFSPPTLGSTRLSSTRRYSLMVVCSILPSASRPVITGWRGRSAGSLL